MELQLNSRRLDIDWLRVLAFVLLIFYHIGMFYVFDWGWHVKSQYQSEFLQNIMLLVNRWRMPLIFLISGFALALIEHKYTCTKLFKLRFTRLFIPLVIGMYVIVPPQTYYQLITHQPFVGNFTEFWLLYSNPHTKIFPSFHHSPLGWVTWNHLWYLAYLFTYTLIYLLLRPALKMVNWQWLDQKLNATALFGAVTVALIALIFWLKQDYPITHDLINDWYNHATSWIYFSLGYVLAKCPKSFTGIVAHRGKFLIAGLFGYLCTITLHNDRLSNFLVAHRFDLPAIEGSIITWIIIYTIIAANVICWLFTVLGYANHYLSSNNNVQRNKILNYMNEAILPWYILHQTVIIVIAMWLTPLKLGGIVEPILVIVLTFATCVIGFEIIKRVNVLRFMFGMKLISKTALQPSLQTA